MSDKRASVERWAVCRCAHEQQNGLTVCELRPAGSAWADTVKCVERCIKKICLCLAVCIEDNGPVIFYALWCFEHQKLTSRNHQNAAGTTCSTSHGVTIARATVIVDRMTGRKLQTYSNHVYAWRTQEEMTESFGRTSPIGSWTIWDDFLCLIIISMNLTFAQSIVNIE